MKWCLVAAGVSDLKRPAEKLSVSQNLGAPPDGIACEIPSLTRPTITVCSFIRHRFHMGAIFDGHYPNQLQSWSRECKPDLILDIFPHPTLQVNFFVGMTGVTQLYRIWECV
jgi:hypothetical protein